MKAITQLILSLFTSWGIYVTANISSLPGATKSNEGLKWIPWSEADLWAASFLSIQRALRMQPKGSVRTKLLAADISSIRGNSNEMARYYNNLAVAACIDGDYQFAQQQITLASQANPTFTEVINTIRHNTGLMFSVKY